MADFGLNMSMDNVSATISAIEDQKQSMKDQFRSLQQTVSSNERMLKDLEKTKDRIQRKRVECELEIAYYQKALYHEHHKTVDLRMTLENVIVEMTDHEIDIRKHEIIEDFWKNQANAMKEELVSFDKPLIQDTNDVPNEIAFLKASLRDVDLSAKACDIANLKQEINNLQNENDLLNDLVKSDGQTISQLKNEIKSLDQSIHGLK